MLGIAFQSFSTEVPNPEGIEWFGTDAATVVALLNYASILLGFLCIMTIILLAMGLNTLPVELTGEFVSQFSLVLSFPEITCMGCLLIYMFTSACQGTLMHGDSFWVGNAGLAAAFLFSSMFVIFLPLVLDREGGLWEKARKINDDNAAKGEQEQRGEISSFIQNAKEAACETCL